eukprot:357894-Chlamydomonas_euryale.AAC.3
MPSQSKSQSEWLRASPRLHSLGDTFTETLSRPATLFTLHTCVAALGVQPEAGYSCTVSKRTERCGTLFGLPQQLDLDALMITARPCCYTSWVAQARAMTGAAANMT